VAFLGRQHNFECCSEGDRVRKCKLASIIQNFNTSGPREIYIVGRALQIKTRSFLHAQLAGQDVSNAAAIELARAVPAEAKGGRHQRRPGLIAGARGLETLNR
jgi:hypothetical protein